jgi:hypothetical protein
MATTTAAQFISWAAGQSPGAILAAAPSLSFGSLGPYVADGVTSADKIAGASGPQAKASAAAAASESNNILNVTAAGLGLVAGAAGAAIGVALKLEEMFETSSAGQAFVKWWTSGSVSSDVTELAVTGFVPVTFGSSPSCRPASQAQGAPPLTSAAQLYDFPIQPKSLAALIIPVLCQGYFQVEQCVPIDRPSQMAWIGPASNLVIASLAALWNSQVVGPSIDYFVPYVPSGSEAGRGWGGWNGYGAIFNDGNPWQEKPPFVIPGQAQYAFQPLSQVPQSVAVPSQEFGQPGFTYGADGNPPGAMWSRISCKSGVWIGSNPALDTVMWIGGAAAALALGIGIYSLAKKKNFFTVARSIPGTIERAL